METFDLKRKDAVLAGYKWDVKDPEAVMVIIHGLAEHAKRYDRFAGEMNSEGVAVYSMDLRGHGDSCGEKGRGWFAKKGGWRVVLGDIEALTRIAKKAHPGVPCVLFGHSIGAVFSQAALAEFGREYRACVLSGVLTGQPGLRQIAPAISWIAGLFGKRKPSRFLDKISYEPYRKAFAPCRTGFDWLSRDRAVVDRYVDDPMCGFMSSPSLFFDLTRLMNYVIKGSSLDKVLKNMHILIISGAKDPCGAFGQTALAFKKMYSSRGVGVKCIVYGEARHEVLNELNRDEAVKDIIEFVRECVADA